VPHPPYVYAFQVVFQGLHAILSVLTHNLLLFPAVAANYFNLILQLCELYPSNVAQLPSDHFQPLVMSLDWGLLQASADVTTPCLQALEELALFHYRERVALRPGLTTQTLSGAPAVGLHPESMSYKLVLVDV
jgi:hypothetical protein